MRIAHRNSQNQNIILKKCAIFHIIIISDITTGKGSLGLMLN